MKTRIMTAVLILFTAIAMIACEQADQSTVLTQQQNVTIKLANVADPNARTLRPDAVATAAKYLVSLTEVSYSEGSGWADVRGSENNKTDVEATIGGEGQSLTLTISDVHIGSYRVSIKGMDGNNVKVLYGESDSPLTVSPTTDGNSISIPLEQVFDNTGDESLEGSVEIPLDWSAVTDDRLDEGFQIKVFDNSGNEHIATYTYDPSTGDKTSDTFTFKTDVTPSRFVRFDLYEADGSTLVSTLRRTYIWVAAGNVSRPMDGEEGIIINDMNLQLAFNIYDFKAEEIDGSTTSVKLSWKSYGAGQLEKINFWYAPSNESRPGEVSFTVDGTKSEHTLGDLTEGTEYRLWYQAVYKNGMVSSIDQYEGVIKTMIYVTGIDVKASGSDPLTTSVGSKFTLSVSITPENATDKSYTFSDVSAYFDDLGNGSFKAKKAGVHTIEVTANGSQTDVSVKDTIKVITRLQAPTGVTANPSAQGIEISKYEVDGAQSYDIFRNGIFLVNTGESTYLDRNVKTSENYTYHVVARLTEGDTNLDSDESNPTEPVSIKDRVINITVPTIEEGFDIVLANVDSLYLMEGVQEEITVSYEKPEGYTLNWYLNEKKLTSNEGSDGVRVTIELTDLHMTATPLTLEITDGSRSFSNSIMVYRIDALDTGVEVTIAGEEYNAGEIYRISSNSTFDTGSGATARTLKLDAKAVTEDGTVASIPDVFFAIDESMQDIATVDGKGNITFKDKAYTSADSPLIVKVWSTNSKDTPTEVKFDVYYATVDPTRLVDAANILIRNELVKADNSFSNDWYAAVNTYDQYNNNGLIAQFDVLWTNVDAYIQINMEEKDINKIESEISEESLESKVNCSGIGSIASNGNILVTYVEVGTLSSGTDYLTSIASTPNKLTVGLKYNQGNAYIELDNIVVRSGKSDTSARGGKYTVTSDLALGIDASPAKFNQVINDADATVTKLLN